MSRGYNGMAGQMGHMPFDAYIRKTEVTDYDELPDQVHQHQRKLLADRRPDRSFLASDQKRDGNSRYESRGRLNLRHSGKRSLSTPNLPDGTFLDHAFLERDPRGSVTGPDFQKATEQQWARKNLINFKSDADHSVPESGINPRQMVTQMKHSFYHAKDRMKIFDTSRGGWHNGFKSQPRLKTSAKAQMTQDGQILDLAEADQGNRKDATSHLSDTPLGWRFYATDHKVKVAKYGHVRANMANKTQDWRANRASAYLDHKTQVSLNGERLNKTLAMLIVDLQGLKKAKHTSMEDSEFANSRDGPANRIRKFSSDDLRAIQNLIEQSADASSHQLLDGTRNNTAKQKQYIRQIFGKTVINPEIIEFISMITKPGYQGDIGDLRDEIISSADDQGLYVEIGTVGKSNEQNQKSRWRTKSGHSVEDSNIAFNYSSAPVITAEIMDKVAFEEFAKKSLCNKQIKRRIDKLTGVNNAISTANMGEFNTINRHIGKMNKTKVRRCIASDTFHSSADDATSVLY